MAAPGEVIAWGRLVLRGAGVRDAAGCRPFALLAVVLPGCEGSHHSVRGPRNPLTEPFAGGIPRPGARRVCGRGFPRVGGGPTSSSHRCLGRHSTGRFALGASPWGLTGWCLWGPSGLSAGLLATRRPTGRGWVGLSPLVLQRASPSPAGPESRHAPSGVGYRGSGWRRLLPWSRRRRSCPPGWSRGR